MSRGVDHGATRRWSRRSPLVAAPTDKPFGVDLLTAMPGGMTDQVRADHRRWGDRLCRRSRGPAEVVEQCHRNNLVVVSMCGKVDHAVRAVEAGCDLVVAQGTEAGGHTGTSGIVPARSPDRRCGR